MVASCFLCSQIEQLVLLHRCQDAEIALETLAVVIVNVFFNHPYEALTVSKPSAVVPFPFQDAPETLHRPVVNTVCYPGHTLRHPCRFQFCVKSAVCILKSSVTVEQRMGIRISCDSRIKGVIYQRIVVTVPDDKGDDSSVVKVKNGTQIYLVLFNTLIPFEFCYIR